MILLINKNDFAGYVDISHNTDFERRLSQHINNAQESEIAALLGDALYYDLLKNKDQSKYVDLLNGKDYTVDGITYVFQGLKPVICLYTYARYIKRSLIHDTDSGTMYKVNSEYTQPVSAKDMTIFSIDSESLAFSYWEKCKKYLNSNSDIYPLWKKDDCALNEIDKVKKTRIYPVGGSNIF